MEEHVRGQGRTPAGTHVPILVEEVLQTLDPRPGEIVVDGTLGYGGHALRFAERIGPTGRLIGLDVDEPELERTRERLAETGTPFSLYRSHFSGLGKALAAEGLTACDVIFADLGASSMQFDDPERGFSYKYDGPLDMRMDQRLKQTAAHILATMPEDQLALAFLELGDEPDHAPIAAKIAARRERPLTRTSELVRLIFRAKKISIEDWKAEAGRLRRRHPAARVFQALRILVNDEMTQLEQLLRVAPYCLNPGGRIGILTFHSGEDGRVIAAFRDGIEQGLYEAWSETGVRPGPEERRGNPRSSSATLRWARRPVQA
jgi:16S rRNA (cytosine1402-N4)-methyltransferase